MQSVRNSRSTHSQLSHFTLVLGGFEVRLISGVYFKSRDRLSNFAEQMVARAQSCNSGHL